MTGLIDILEIKILTLIFPFALVLTFFAIAISRYWISSLQWQLTDRSRFSNDESRALAMLQGSRVTNPVVRLDDTEPDDDLYIEELLTNGKFLAARDYVRDLKHLALEQSDHATARYYDAYERRVSRLKIR
jgi:hypothetical protein